MAAKPFQHTPGGPIYNCKYEIAVPLFDADGDPITGGANLVLAYYIDGGTEGAGNTPEEMGGGYYRCSFEYTHLAGADVGCVLASSTEGAKNTLFELRPRRLPVILAGTAGEGGANTIMLDGLTAPIQADALLDCYVRCSNNTPAGVQGLVGQIVAYDGDTFTATVHGNWTVEPTNQTTYEVLLANRAVNTVRILGTDPPELPLASLTIYHADIDLSVDAATGQDEYTVTWMRDGALVPFADATEVTIQVVKRADGTDLVAEDSMSAVAQTGAWKYDEDTNVVTPGEAVLVIVTATIDDETQTFTRMISRDSEAA